MQNHADNLATRASAALSPPIDQTEFERLLLDPNIPDSALRPYLKIELTESEAFRPAVVVDRSKVTFTAEESALALASFNGIARWRRQQRYRQKIGSWKGLRVVAEGDSWHQFPFLVDDVVDHLFERYAIYCVSAAGDLLSGIAKADELTAAIAAEKPDVVLLSAGGNDLLGDGQLARYLSPFAVGKKPEDYLGPGFFTLLGQLSESYGQIIRKAVSQGVRRVVCHSYDYAIPAGGPWLGRPMARVGIKDPSLQRAIVRLLIDHFHKALTALSHAPDLTGRLFVADCRGSVHAWFDELHPASPDFGAVANRIAALVEAPATVASTTEAPVSRSRPDWETEAAIALLGQSEATLLAEIGRRSQIMQVSPDAAGDPSPQLSATSLESLPAPLVELGTRIFARLERELFSLLCGPSADGNDERDKLRDAFGLGEAAMIAAITGALTSGLAVAPLLAPLIAAVIVKRGVTPAWQTTCEVWAERLSPT